VVNTRDAISSVSSQAKEGVSHNLVMQTKVEVAVTAGIPSNTVATGALGGDVRSKLIELIGPARFERDFAGSVKLVQDAHGDLSVRVASVASREVIEGRYGAMLAAAAAPGVIRFEVGVAEPESVHSQSGEFVDEADGPQRSGPFADRSATSGLRAVQHEPAPSLEEIFTWPGTQMALDAAQRLTSGQMPRGSSLVLHGGCGLGKTHILRAIAAQASKQRTGMSVRIITAEQFSNEFVAAIRSGKSERMERFRQIYRGADLLCIDDLQTLASKTATQLELQHTLDAIASRGGHAVMTCSMHPKLVHGLSASLVSRLSAALVVGLQAPDEAATVRLVSLLAQKRGLVIDGPVATALVQSATIRQAGQPPRLPSVRELEGVVLKIEAVHRLLGGAMVGARGDGSANLVGMLTVKTALQDAQRSSESVLARIGPKPMLRVSDVIDAVNMRLGVSMDELAGSGRHQRVVLARAAITLLARELTNASYPEIARAVGRPNHSTVITAHQRLTKQMREGFAMDLADGRGRRPVSELISEVRTHIAGPSASQTA
jgi:chromosomal replication initiator protein